MSAVFLCMCNDNRDRLKLYVATFFVPLCLSLCAFFMRVRMLGRCVCGPLSKPYVFFDFAGLVISVCQFFYFFLHIP